MVGKDIIYKRLFANSVEEGKCRIWIGATNPNGYGRVWDGERMRLAHRLVAYAKLGFDLNSNLNVLHKCDNPACINPDHLFIGDQYDNIQDAKSKGRLRGNTLKGKRTHCPKGHPFSGDNLVVYGKSRHCRTCDIQRNRNRRMRMNGK